MIKRYIKSKFVAIATNYIKLATKLLEINNEDLALMGTTVTDTYGYQRRELVIKWCILKAVVFLSFAGQDTSDLTKHLEGLSRTH